MVENPNPAESFGIAAKQVVNFLESKSVPIIYANFNANYVDILGNNGDVRFTALVFEKNVSRGRIVIPTITNINLGEIKSLGLGTGLVYVWENSMAEYGILGAQGVNNPRFWRQVGYAPVANDRDFWIKMFS